MAKKIRLRYDAVCVDCGEALAAGTEARWFGRGRVSCCGKPATSTRSPSRANPFAAAFDPPTDSTPPKASPRPSPADEHREVIAAHDEVIAALRGDLKRCRETLDTVRLAGEQARRDVHGLTLDLQEARETIVRQNAEKRALQAQVDEARASAAERASALPNPLAPVLQQARADAKRLIAERDAARRELASMREALGL